MSRGVARPPCLLGT